ncbi:MAG: TonB-dependent receptor, partial [Pseudomonadota bacterium]
SIRGINNLVSGENAFINSIGIYLDEFSVASVPNQVANPFLPDMERVEVLRGPQGTYFGRNSLGGALNLTTKSPVAETEGFIQGGFETYDNAGDMYSVTGMINGAVTDNFLVRAVAHVENSSGLVENINPTGAKDSGHNSYMVRLKSLWQPTDATSVGFTLIYSDEDQGTDENVPSGVLDLDTTDTLGISDALDPGTGFWPNNRNQLSHDLFESNKLESTVAILNVAHEINDAWTMKWITGVIDAEQTRLFDNDLIGGADVLRRDNLYEGTSFSTELRFEFISDSYELVFGGLYASDDQEQDNKVGVSSDPTATVNGVGFLPPFPEGLGLALNSKNFEVESIAVFADLTWHLSDRTDLIVGGRYTSDDVTNGVQGFGIGPGPLCNAACLGAGPADPNFFPSFTNFARPPANAEESFTDFSPRLGIRFQVNDDWNIYGTVSKGYKAGGSSVGNNTNDNNVPFIVPFAEETLWNYEAGFKSELMDQRVRFNGSVFYLEWSDLQLEAFRFLTPGDLSSNFEQTVNAEEAEAFGAEFELVALVSDNFTVGGAVGFLDTEITSNSTAEITGGFVVNLQGLEIPKAPELTFNVFGEYRWPLANNELWIRAELIHRDGQYSDVEGLTNLQTRGPSPNSGLVRTLTSEFPYRSPDYDVVNLRGGLEWDRASLTFFVQNATDEEYYTGTQENFGASGIRLRPHPRTIGVSAQFKF